MLRDLCCTAGAGIENCFLSTVQLLVGGYYDVEIVDHEFDFKNPSTSSNLQNAREVTVSAQP